MINTSLLLKIISESPSKLTYFAIGSANNAEHQFPSFLLNMILYDNSFSKQQELF